MDERNPTVQAQLIPPSLRKDCVLFYTEDFRELAERIAEHSQGHIKLGKIRWRWELSSHRQLGKRAYLPFRTLY